MTTPADPNTLDPEQIRKLPFRRELPYNGLTPEQVRAIGFDPAEVEANRHLANEARAESRREEDAGVLAAARQAVENGDAFPAEAAQALLLAGRREAHDAFVALWQAEERAAALEEQAEAVQWMDAEQYSAHAAEQSRQRLAASAAEVDRLRTQLAAAQVATLKEDLDAAIGGHQIAPAVESTIVENLKAGGLLPSTPQERTDLIESAVRQTAVLGDAERAIHEQIRAEWSALRKSNGARDGLTTAADIATAEQAYKSARFKQLADAKMIDLDSLKPGPTAEEQSAALAEKYRADNERSAAFHRQVERLKEPTENRDRGESSSANRRAYQDAMARAEAEAHVGTIRTSLSEPPETKQKTGYGPDGTWPDELGPAL